MSAKTCAVIGCVTLLIASGCESRAYKELHQRYIALEDEHQRVTEQMKEVWRQSLKARIPLVRQLETGQPMAVDARYIKTLQLSPAPHYRNKWTATVTYLADQEGVTPNYVIYLFDERGLNIGHLHRKRGGSLGLTKGALKKGVQENEDAGVIDLLLGEDPYYYWIRFVE